jgi:hypothetical protein
MTFDLPPPDLQVSFALKLTEARTLILQDALKATIKSLDIVELDKQLAACAPKAGLSILAALTAGFTECWTIVNVDRADLEQARQESPSTNRFYRLSDLLDQNSGGYQDFHDRIQALTGLASS